MDSYEEKLKLSARFKSSLLTRSMTLHITPHDPPDKTLPRSNSIKKFYGSFESIFPSGNSINGKVKQLCSLFESANSSARGEIHPQTKPKYTRSSIPESRISPFNINPLIWLPGTEDRIVVYFTSLHGVRKTFEDCYSVKTIFRGFRVWVDERDISMDSAYRKELEKALGESRVSLPQVFIGGKHVGGAEIVKQLYEYGDLAKMISGFPVRKPGHVCEGCGDIRFVPCGYCDGSRKIFEEDEGVLKRCLECNENGLIRCPNCCT